ncbi:hypothetical protein AB0N89_21490 [Amycolatopsis sp. NPDC089917]|uniref:hypothetical protein n=1 Tax=Amycolatopsis sp. NPDC089917 TaxID=3155187 RepID=UPI00342876F0
MIESAINAVATPTTLFRADPVQEWVALLKTAATRVEEEIATRCPEVCLEIVRVPTVLVSRWVRG